MEGGNSIENRLHFLKERLEGVVATLSENRLFNEIFLKTVQPMLKKVQYLEIMNLTLKKDSKINSEAVKQYKQVNFEEADNTLKYLKKLIHQADSRKSRPNCENKVLEMRKELLEIHGVLEKISLLKAAEETRSIGRAIFAQHFLESFNDAGSTNLENIYGSALADKRAYLDFFEGFVSWNFKIANKGVPVITKKHVPEIAEILAPKCVIEGTSKNYVASRHIPVEDVAAIGHIDAAATIGLVDTANATPADAVVANSALVDADVAYAASVNFHAGKDAQVDAVTAICRANAVATIGNVDVVVAILKDLEKLIDLTEKRKCSKYSKNEILKMRKELLEIHRVLEKISLKKAIEESRSIGRAIFTKIFEDPFDVEGLSNLQNIYGDAFADKRAYLDAFESFAGWDFKNADKGALTIGKKHVPEIIGILAPERTIESIPVKSLACRRIPVNVATAPLEAATTTAATPWEAVDVETPSDAVATTAPVDAVATTAPGDAVATAAPGDAVATAVPGDAVFAPVDEDDDAIGAV